MIITITITIQINKKIINHILFIFTYILYYINFTKSWIVNIYSKNHHIKNFILIINHGNNDIIYFFIIILLFLPFIYYRHYNLITFPIFYSNIPNKQNIINLTNCYLNLVFCVFNFFLPSIYTILNHPKRLYIKKTKTLPLNDKSE